MIVVKKMAEVLVMDTVLLAAGRQIQTAKGPDTV